MAQHWLRDEEEAWWSSWSETIREPTTRHLALSGRVPGDAEPGLLPPLPSLGAAGRSPIYRMETAIKIVVSFRAPLLL